MSWRADLAVLRHLLFPANRGATHAERLSDFYGAQAEGYDGYRRRLLHGREELLASLPFPTGGVWVDIGAGTGSNAEALGGRLAGLRRALLVDVCPPLLNLARRRILDRGWENVEAVAADAEQFRSPEPADVVTFSYSLTMIPDWFRALDRAFDALKPGGWIGVVDFTVSRKWPAQGLRRHPGWIRALWPPAFAWDNVFLSTDHLPYLRYRFRQERLEERVGSVPFLPWVRSPWYLFIGRKPL
jgi:S-adenosylmethionine-diacylgycerolhomoserine-N-methlytransferase